MIVLYACAVLAAGFALESLQRVLKHHHEHTWLEIPEHKRTAIRWLTFAIVAVTVYGLVVARMITEICLAVLAVVLIVVVERKLQVRVQVRHHTKGTVKPLAHAMALEIGTPPETAHRSITIRPDYSTAKGLEDVGTIVLPDWYPANPGQREQIEHLVKSRLGMDLSFTWHTSKRPMTLQIARAPIPPTLVPFADMLPAIRALPTDKVLLGVTGRGDKKLWDMSSEDPHCLVSANTRRGKTRLLLLIACQVLFQGAEKVTAIDPKRVGIDEALAGIPGVDVHSDPRNVPDMWDAVKRFREFMDARIDAYTEDRTMEFKRALLIIDEVSQFAAMSKVYWDSIRQKTDKAVPPVWNDVAAILWQGAQFGCSMLVFGQRIEHSTLGGLIDSFGTRLLAGFQKRTYERLVGIPPVPASQRPRGRFLYFDGEQPQWIQTVLGSDQELRSLALEGKPIAKPTLAEILEVTENGGK